MARRAKHAWPRRARAESAPPGENGGNGAGPCQGKRAWIVPSAAAIALAGAITLAGVPQAWGPHAWGLASLSGLPLFTRIRKHEVLEHATRQRILEAVAARPGMTLQALQAELGVAWGTTVHHVHVLQRHARLVSVRQGPRRLLFVASTPEGRARAELALLRTVTAHGIALAVQRQPGVQQVEICRLLGVRSPSASKHLSRLTAAGLVTVERAGNSRRYSPTPRLGEVLGLRLRAGEGHPGAGAMRPPRPPHLRTWPSPPDDRTPSIEPAPVSTGPTGAPPGSPPG